MDERRLLRKAGRVYKVRACAAALEVRGLGHVVVFGWPDALLVLRILVQRAHPDWTNRQIAAFLREDLEL